MPKVSDGRSVRVGLVGPKEKLESVSDGHQVNIPEPAMCWKRPLEQRLATEWIVVPLLGWVFGPEVAEERVEKRHYM